MIRLSLITVATHLQRHNSLSCCQPFKVVYSLVCIDFDQYIGYALRTSRHPRLALMCPQSRVNLFRYIYIYIFLSKLLLFGIVDAAFNRRLIFLFHTEILLIAVCSP